MPLLILQGPSACPRQDKRPTRCIPKGCLTHGMALARWRTVAPTHSVQFLCLSTNNKAPYITGALRFLKGKTGYFDSGVPDSFFSCFCSLPLFEELLLFISLQHSFSATQHSCFDLHAFFASLEAFVSAIAEPASTAHNVTNATNRFTVSLLKSGLWYETSEKSATNLTTLSLKHKKKNDTA